MTLYDFDKAIAGEGYPVICGLDEAGRGPLAGRVYAAACVLPADFEPEFLNDSKKLTAKRREKLYDEIIANAVDYAVAFADEKEIDALNILEASMLSMRRAAAQLSVKPNIYLVDGNRHPKIAGLCRTVVQGDGKSAAIAAASILAKVSRDRYMTAMAEKYPGYGFEKHFGYPVKAHYAAIAERGVCEIHRKTFLKNLEKKHPAASKGAMGEDAAAVFLENRGFRILSRNFKVFEGELDIVAERNALIHIVEVKQRANDSIERPAAWVNKTKQRRLRTAALHWLSQSGCKLPLCFDIIEILGEEITLIENAF